MTSPNNQAAAIARHYIVDMARGRLAVLDSRTGTNTEAVISACQGGRIEADVALVIGNNTGSGVFERAATRGVPTLHLSSLAYPEAMELDRAMLRALSEYRVTHLALAGYTKLIGTEVLAAYRGRAFNLHPSLLPAFGGKGMYGHRVHAAVLASGVPVTGVTVHLITDTYDDGPIIAQAEVKVRTDDDVYSLAARVEEAGRELLVRVLSSFFSPPGGR